MGRIRFLPAGVISAIAAGEVVERPAVVIKELIENAVDAEATSIQVRIEGNQLERLVVSDNGHGIEPEDLPLAVERHSTSKIFHPDDLHQIRTLGFRGEALASVASVSHLILQSRTPDRTEGYQLIVDHGQVLPVQPIGHPPGTTVVIEDLFAHHPARRKFLKQPAVELKHIIDVVMRQALAHHQIGFTLQYHTKELLRVPPQSSLDQRLQSLFSQNEQSLFLPFSADFTYLQATGFLGKPQLASRTKRKQFLFINGRPVTHAGLAHQIKTTYGSLIEPKSEPAFVLHLQIHPSLIDINIHPRKEEVRFMDEQQVLSLLHQTIAEQLKSSDLGYAYAPEETWNDFTVRDTPLELNRKASPQTGSILRELVTTWHMNQPQENTILQIDQTYLVTSTPTGIIVVDQHAAHERILFEQFMASLQDYLAKTPLAERMVMVDQPLVLKLSSANVQLLTDNLESLQAIGFAIEPFGKDTFQVTHVPNLLKDRNIQLLITQLLDDLNENRPVRGVDGIAERTIAYLACRSAIKAGEPLTLDQRRELLAKLSATSNQATCPHGRPTNITFSVSELEKLFKRR